MKNLNNTTQLIGRVVNNAELRTANNGQQVVSFRFAVDCSYVNKESERINRADYYDVERWFKADKEVKMQNVFVKGAMFMLTGKIVSKAFIDKKTNKIVQKLGLNMADSLLLTNPKKNG